MSSIRTTSRPSRVSAPPQLLVRRRPDLLCAVVSRVSSPAAKATSLPPPYRSIRPIERGITTAAQVSSGDTEEVCASASHSSAGVNASWNEDAIRGPSSHKIASFAVVLALMAAAAAKIPSRAAMRFSTFVEIFERAR